MSTLNPIPQTPVSQIPFFSTVAGRAVSKALTVGILAALSALFKDPSLTSFVASNGTLVTILSLVRDIGDQSIPNLPTS